MFFNIIRKYYIHEHYVLIAILFMEIFISKENKWPSQEIILSKLVEVSFINYQRQLYKVKSNSFVNKKSIMFTITNFNVNVYVASNGALYYESSVKIAQGYF